MFTALVVVLHVIVCLFLILIILLQTGKGADIGAVFGGGSSHTVFGSSGASSFLSRLTVAAAVTFMVTCIVLSYFAGKTTSLEGSIIQEQSASRMPGPGEGPKETIPDSATRQETPSAPAEKPTTPATTQTPAVPAEKPSTPAQAPAPAPAPADK